MTYSKKQMKPLIDKYQINPETNKLFKSIIEMFDNQPNYQFWAVKCVFSKTMTFDTLVEIHDWTVANQTMIKNLEKKNIVSYSSESAIHQLLREMNALENVAIIKDVISHFNTEQRKELTSAILPVNLNGLEASRNAMVDKWSKIFIKFNRLSQDRKNNFYTKASSVHNVDSLMELIVECLNESYLWNKEDFLAYLTNNTTGCEVVYENGLVLIISVPDFKTSKILCGLGRTQWCISMEQHHWDNYVGRIGGNRKQYFLFDFNRRETDPFAHIGFTIEKGNGIVEAQSGDNQPMLSDYSNGRETFNINTALTAVGAKMSDLLTIPANSKYAWDAKSICSYVSKNPEMFSIAYNKNNRLVINILSTEGFKEIASHTFVNSNNMVVDDYYKVYTVIDLNLEHNDENAMVFMRYRTDEYGDCTFFNAFNLFNNQIDINTFFGSIGISQNDFLNMEKIKPSIMLHKLIDKNDEDGAIMLIKENWDEIDVNYRLNNKLPIYQLLNNRMYDLFSLIITHPTFDTTLEDGFGESLLEGLIYIYTGDDVMLSEDENTCLEMMIKSILDSGSFDMNYTDWNNDTALKISCESKKTAWIVKRLVDNPRVDVNLVNNQGHSPLFTALSNNNIEAVEALRSRSDLVVSAKEAKMLKSLANSTSNELEMATSVAE